MPGRIVYVNGQWKSETEATVSIFDRGFLMADGVYEVTSVLGGKLIDFDGHRARLTRSLSELGMDDPFTGDSLLALHREIMEHNGLVNGAIYLQVTRGNPGDRDFVFPDRETTPQTVVMFTQQRPDLDDPYPIRKGLKIMTLPDLRWGRRDIKTIQLLYASMAKTEAVRKGKHDAWLVEDGHVTEGSSANAYIVRGGEIVSHPLTNRVLHGITRASLLKFIEGTGYRLSERRFTVEEAMSADEAFITSATTFVTPVVEIDGHAVGDGKIGPVVQQLRRIYVDECLRRAT